MLYEKDTAYGADNPVGGDSPYRRTRIHRTTRHWFVTLLLALLLCANSVGSWAFPPMIAPGRTFDRRTDGQWH